MERSRSTGNKMPSASYLLDFQGSMDIHHQPHSNASLHHHQGSMVHPPMHDNFPLTAGRTHDCDQQPTLRITDYKKCEHGKTSMSDEDDPSFNTEDGVDGHDEASKGKKVSLWQRMKWTDVMVKILITAVSYIGDDASADCNGGGKRKFAMLQKKGKWKVVSKVMAERGCYVSPQQCEDKFNDLNKRYKRLNDILGRGTSCKVVENPALLDLMDQLSGKAKDDVRKILSSKHLFYEEMCSYHNGNRLHLPADPALQRSLQLVLSKRDDYDTRAAAHDDTDEDDRGTDTDDRENENEGNNMVHGVFRESCFPKKMKQGVGHGDLGLENTSSQGISVDINQLFYEGPKADWVHQQWLSSRSLQLEERRLQIQAQMVELDGQRFKWQRFSKKKDRELDKMRVENERMKLENKRLALELKRKELEVKLN